jgi:hypothetical protein
MWTILYRGIPVASRSTREEAHEYAHVYAQKVRRGGFVIDSKSCTMRIF